MNSRRIVVMIILLLCLSALLARLFYLNFIDKGFLQQQGDSRSMRHIVLAAKRGMIVDRYDVPLAVSTPVAAIIVDPQDLNKADPEWPEALKLLNLNPSQVAKQLLARQNSNFMYLKRQLPPALAAKIKALNVKGVYVQPEYRRFYPNGDVFAQVIGFNSIDDQGQEGIELYYNKWLSGKDGYKNVQRDLKGQAVSQIGDYRPAEDGKPIALSIDRRIQYLTYHALVQEQQKTKALAATAVVMDVRSGEILAIATVPSFNPNSRADRKADDARNRAVTDVFEPGSTMKPFSAIAILQSGRYTPDSIVDTNPGYITIGNRTFHDVHDYGLLTLTGVLQKSSNVGIAKMILSISPAYLLNLLPSLGFGKLTGIDFPGESAGVLPRRSNWGKIPLASLAFGYGISCTVVQLAEAYATLADNGIMHSPTLLRQAQVPAGKPVLPANLANQVLNMLQTVIETGGTGTKAQVFGYQIAGKTGTSRKAVGGHYLQGHYIGLFAGVAPLSNPRLVMVVMIDDPRGGEYFGGSVAAPVFSQVMQQSLRLLAIPPDRIPAAAGKVKVSS